MRSIRRSLLGYLLVLIALALSAVGGLVDRFANAAIRQREASEEGRINKNFELQQHSAKVKFDAELVAEAKVKAGEVHRTMGFLSPSGWGRPGGFRSGSGAGPGPNPERSPPPGPAPNPGTPPVPNPGAGNAPQPPIRASEEEAREFRLRTGLWQVALPIGVEPVVAFALLQPKIDIPRESRRYYPFPGWSEYDAPRVVQRIGDVLHKAFDDEHVGHFQFTLVGTYPSMGSYSGRPNRTSDTVVVAQLGSELALAPSWLEPNQDIEPKLDEVTLPDKGPCRRVVTGTAGGTRPLDFFFPLPSPPQFGPAGTAIRYPLYQPFRGPDVRLRVFVHHARPYSELDARLAADQQERDAQIARVRAETQTELAGLRARLVVIGAATFAALVLGGWFFVARGLAPLGVLSDAVSQVSEKDFRLSVGAEELGRELAPIHARITQTLTLLQRAFAREKQAVADISHELRTPIASLLATIDVALRKPRTPEQYRTTLDECRLISKQLGQLVERIMTLAALDSGNDHTHVTRTDAGELAVGCAAVIRPLAAANNVGLAVRAEEGVVIETDPGKLREVLMNLLHNAVEYNEPDGTIELSVRREGASAVFEIRDTGIGMTADVRERIFERFYRADSSRHATGVHAGLGLAIVKEYVARLNGAITVESVPGVGTTFRVTLPAPTGEPPLSADRVRARAAAPVAS